MVAVDGEASDGGRWRKRWWRLVGCWRWSLGFFAASVVFKISLFSSSNNFSSNCARLLILYSPGAG